MDALAGTDKPFDFAQFGVNFKTDIPKYQSNKSMEYVEEETRSLAEQLEKVKIKTLEERN
jgi:hypothetical protein